MEEFETEEVLTSETSPLTFVTSTVLVVEVVVDVVVVVVFEESTLDIPTEESRSASSFLIISTYQKQIWSASRCLPFYFLS